MEYVVLNNKVKMPILGFGTYFPKVSETKDAVLEALNNGYRSLDTAKWYINELEVAKAIKESGVKREDLFITCKVEPNGYFKTMNDIYDTLNRLDTTYLDLILIHWPAGDILESYKALETMYDRKIARAIGISNFNTELCDFLLNNCRIKPQVNQIETHLYFQEKKMHKYLKSKKIYHESWSPFAEGVLDVFNNELVLKLAKKYKKKPSQILLKFLIQSDVIVIPRSTDPKHIKENIKVFDFTIDDKDMKLLKKEDRKQQLSGWPVVMKSETDY